MTTPAVLFAISAVVIAYVTVGYPLLLYFLTRLFPRPIRKSDGVKTVSIIIPVRNGERWLSRKLDSLLAQNYPKELVGILVVSDGSTDATDEIACLYAERGVRLMRVPAGAKPAALQHA